MQPFLYPLCVIQHSSKPGDLRAERLASGICQLVQASSFDTRFIRHDLADPALFDHVARRAVHGPGSDGYVSFRELLRHLVEAVAVIGASWLAVQDVDIALLHRFTSFHVSPPDMSSLDMSFFDIYHVTTYVACQHIFEK